MLSMAKQVRVRHLPKHTVLRSGQRPHKPYKYESSSSSPDKLHETDSDKLKTGAVPEINAKYNHVTLRGERVGGDRSLNEKAGNVRRENREQVLQLVIADTEDE